MADVIPPMNLTPEATPWGRTMQNLVTELQRSVSRHAGETANASSVAKSSTRVLTENVQGLTSLTTDLQAQVNALTSAAISTTSVTASGAVSAGSLAVSGAASTSGNLTVGGLIRNVSAYSNPITSSYRNLFVTSTDGQFGYNLSSRKFKQDIETAIIDPKDVLSLRLATYRYIQAVEDYGDEAAIEHGLIAEEVEAAGLGWLVDHDEDGQPLTLRFHLIAMALLPVVQDLNMRLARLEAMREVSN